MIKMGVDEVIQAAADLVDHPDKPDVPDGDYRRGVIDLATALCLGDADDEYARAVMGYAVCGVHRHPRESR